MGLRKDLRVWAMGWLALLAIFPNDLSAQPATRKEKVKAAAGVVERIFSAHAAARHLPGLAWGVIYDGGLVVSGGCGLADLGQQRPATPQSLFRAASMSKSFTAMAILQLRDAGRLRLDDPAALYLPELKALRPVTADAPEITLRHLLTHGAGLPEDNPWGDRQLARTDAELLALLPEISMANAPGVAYEYSNLGFAILGQIVQRVSGMDFTVYTRELIFKPLGMGSSIWEYAGAPPERLVRGYARSGASFTELPMEHHGAYGAMGGLVTSVEDFARYAAFHLSAWPPRDEADAGPLRRSSLREMHHPWRFYSLLPDADPAAGAPCPAAQAYAYGLRWQSDCGGMVAVGHSGGLPGFGSNWTMLPDYGIAVVSFTNLTYATTTAINRTVLDTLIALAGLEPRQPPVSAILEKRKYELIGMLPEWQGARESGIFAENFFLDNPPAELARLSRQLFAEAGEIRGAGPMRPLNNLRGSFLLEGSRKDISLFFTLTPERVPTIQELKMTLVEKSGG